MFFNILLLTTMESISFADATLANEMKKRIVTPF